MSEEFELWSSECPQDVFMAMDREDILPKGKRGVNLSVCFEKDKEPNVFYYADSEDESIYYPSPEHKFIGFICYRNSIVYHHVDNICYKVLHFDSAESRNKFINGETSHPLCNELLPYFRPQQIDNPKRRHQNQTYVKSASKN